MTEKILGSANSGAQELPQRDPSLNFRLDELTPYRNLQEAVDDFSDYWNTFEENPRNSQTVEDWETRVGSIFGKLSKSSEIFGAWPPDTNIGQTVMFFGTIISVFKGGTSIEWEVIEEKIEKPIYESLEKNLNTLQQNMEHLEPRAQRAAVMLATEASQAGENQKENLDFVINNLDLAFSTAEDEDDVEFYATEIIATIFKSGTLDQTQQTRQLIHTKLNQARSNADNDTLSYIPLILAHTYRDKDPKVNLQGEFLIKEHIQHIFEMDYRDLWATWYTSDKRNLPESGEYRITKNYEALCELEQKRPGIGPVLHNEFGVSDFARYPVDMLIRQYDERDSKTSKNGVVVFPEDDWNGAFYSTQNVLQNLTEALGEEYIIRVYERKNARGVVSALNSSRHRYGKAEFLILGAHGDRDIMAFGPDKSDIVEKEHLVRSGGQALRHAFVENPTIILMSCSTGEIGGIGEQISKLGFQGATVIAPDKSVSIKSISVDRDANSKLTFEVEYYEYESDSEEDSEE